MEERIVVSRQRETAWLVMAIAAGVLLLAVGALSFADGTDLGTLEGGGCTAGLLAIGVLLLAYGVVGFRPLKVAFSDDGMRWVDKMGKETFVRWEDVETVRVIEGAKPIRIGFSMLSDADKYSATYIVGKEGRS